MMSVRELLSRHAEDLVALIATPRRSWLGLRHASAPRSLVGTSKPWWAFGSSICFARVGSSPRSSFRTVHRTIGELDFVFEDSQGVPWHWEVAVKFYLCKAVTPGVQLRTDAFWGAMTQDRLDKKLAVIFDRQLGMPYLPEGRLALAAAGFEVGAGGEAGASGEEERHCEAAPRGEAFSGGGHPQHRISEAVF